VQHMPPPQPARPSPGKGRTKGVWVGETGRTGESGALSVLMELGERGPVCHASGGKAPPAQLRVSYRSQKTI